MLDSCDKWRNMYRCITYVHALVFWWINLVKLKFSGSPSLDSFCLGRAAAVFYSKSWAQNERKLLVNPMHISPVLQLAGIQVLLWKALPWSVDFNQKRNYPYWAWLNQLEVFQRWFRIPVSEKAQTLWTHCGKGKAIETMKGSVMAKGWWWGGIGKAWAFRTASRFYRLIYGEYIHLSNPRKHQEWSLL